MVNAWRTWDWRFPGGSVLVTVLLKVVGPLAKGFWECTGFKPGLPEHQ